VKAIVCGGREYADGALVKETLDPLGITLLIEGGANGADSLAREWARARGTHTARVDALWEFHGKAAGPLRNTAMLLLNPDLVVAFPGGSGTESMVKLAEASGVKVIRVRTRDSADHQRNETK
jgi:SLOG family YspA-like protein